MILVVDARVAIKWFFRSRTDEPVVDKALEILNGVDPGEIDLIQPPHFVAEVAAVLPREKPNEALDDLNDLLSMELWGIEESFIYNTATKLSIQFNHHIFDTLYHATALHTPKAVFVTADQRYYSRAEKLNQIVLLRDLDLSIY